MISGGLQGIFFLVNLEENMFTMARIKAVRYKGKEFFLNHLSANDYYSEKEKITGVWHGKLADDFQLQNMPVTADVFSLFQQN